MEEYLMTKNLPPSLWFFSKLDFPGRGFPLTELSSDLSIHVLNFHRDRIKLLIQMEKV